METEKVDFKKEYKDLYLPPKKPVLIDVPEMKFIMVDGKGNPNDENGEYQQAVELLYAFSYTIKMSKKSGNQPAGYFDYVVPPLEGLWWMSDNKKPEFINKDLFCWTSMIRQPDFVTEEVFQWACDEVRRKKSGLDPSKAYLDTFTEGMCVQILHVGHYDEEPATIEKIDVFTEANHLKNAISTVNREGKTRQHHEIYLSDPRRTKPEKLKTVIRIPVEKTN